MSDEPNEIPADREEPVGVPAVRGDPEITGAHARQAERFDPDDPESLDEAAKVVRAFQSLAHGGTEAGLDPLSMLRGAAACAALVRGEGSYTAAGERAGVAVNFLRKWARVHDLPIAIRRHIAQGDIAPTAAMHIARVTGDARFLLAWAILDHDLSVDVVREVASEVTDGRPIEQVLRDHDVVLGEMAITLPLPVYREARRHASLSGETLDTIVVLALRDWLGNQ